MTLLELRDKVRKWDLQHAGNPIASSHYATILEQLDYHAVRDWRVYLPAQHPDFNASYMERLAAWIGNVTDEADQKLLLEYALYISFFSHDDFVGLYKTAFDREIARWVVSQVGARLEPNGWQDMDKLVHKEIHRCTWFCPITDSMDINEFYKVNNLQGVGHRPSFFTLQMLAEGSLAPDQLLATNVRHYMANPSFDPKKPLPPLERLVLLEDFVGSGSQCLDAVRWALGSLGKPVLFVPLVLCPNGAESLRLEEKNSNGQLTVCPVIELRSSDLLGPKRPAEQGWGKAEEVEKLVKRCAANFPFKYEDFGYEKTGCSLVTFANTPDNTIPIVHDQARGNWNPLFPRVYRDS